MCCPLVVDPLTFGSLLVFIGLATYFFSVLIEMSMLAKRRKRRAVEGHSIFLTEGKQLLV